MSKKKIVVAVHESTKEAMEKAKLVKSETYDSVINRALEALAQEQNKAK
jgi:hypothetical protein